MTQDCTPLIIIQKLEAFCGKYSKKKCFKAGDTFNNNEGMA